MARQDDGEALDNCRAKCASGQTCGLKVDTIVGYAVRYNFTHCYASMG